MAFPTDWSLLQKITVDNTKVSGSANLTDFPTLITEDNIIANTWTNTDDGGGDVRMSSDEAGSNQIPLEVVTFDNSGETCELWTKITLDHDDNTIIYLWGDNTTETQPAVDATFGAESVWNSAYKIVTHLGDTTDSTSNGYDGTKKSASEPANTSSGKIGAAQDFDGIDDYIAFSNAGVASNQSGTITLWANSDNYASVGRMIASGDEATTTSYWGLYSYGALTHRCKNGPQDTEDRIYGDTALTNDTTYFVATKSDGSTISMFVNGIKQTVTVSSGTNTGRWFGDFAPLDNLMMGILKRSTFATPFSGIIDEVHISNTDRTDGWIITEYNNQNSPSTFATGASVSLIKELSGVAQASIKKVAGVAIASVKKVAGVANA